MIEFEVYCEDEMKAQIERALGDLRNKTPRVISSAANRTAVEARKLLAKMAQKKYSVQSAKFQKKMDIKKAKVAKPTAIIIATGKPLQMINFDVMPKSYNPKRKKAPKGKVLTASSMKSLQNGDLKAFIVRFKNGHKTLAQRTGRFNPDGETKFIQQCKVLYSPSIPAMLASEENVYGPLKIQIKEIYRQQCLIEIQKIINKSGGN